MQCTTFDSPRPSHGGFKVQSTYCGYTDMSTNTPKTVDAGWQWVNAGYTVNSTVMMGGVSRTLI